MKKTTTTTLTCRVPTPSCELDILRVVSQLTDTPVAFDASATGGIELTVSSRNAFTQKTTETKAVTLVGCVRHLTTQYAPELWDQTGQVESWVSAAETSLLSVLRKETEGEIMADSVQDFIHRIDSHLAAGAAGKLAYLVGETATAADVCVAIPLVAIALERFPSLAWPSKALQWVETVLTQLDGVIVDKSAMAWAKWKGSLNQGAAASSGSPPALAAEPAAADSGDNKIINLLQDYGLEHTVYSHPLSMTAEELVENAPLPDGETHTKNLFLRDKKYGLFLVTVATNAKHTTPVQTKELGKLLGLQGKTNLRLADEKTLWDELHAKPGCVGPLCAALGKKDADPKVQLVLDESLFQKYTKIHSHPLQNDMSVAMTPDAYKEFFRKAGVEPMMIDFGQAGAADAPAGKAPANRPPAAKKKGGGDASAAAAKPTQSLNKKTAEKGQTLLALQWKKSENFAMWYSDVIVLSEMIAYYDISGCYILRPWSYKIWELVQEWFNPAIQALGVENSYFPLFVSQERLEKEKDHVEGFAPEVAWVTRSGDGELAKPIAVRPTSETIMYPAFSDWIKSHRDLPLKLNQWSNVVRWEFKDPTPFLRSREFLWQEGHTAHVSFEDADVMVMQALELYRQVYEELMAVPVIKGKKTEKEKFAGGHTTTTVEAYIHGSGRAIQGATSHNLGQNFGKMFDIKFQDDKGTSQIAWQTSWGLTTRTIGVMVMVHGDDQGLVLPPKVAPLQVVIVAIVSKKLPPETASPYCNAIIKDLEASGIRAKFDDREMYNPGWKYAHWEQKGVPIRIEVGPRDMEQKQARIVIRHNGDKLDLPVEGLGAALKLKLDEIHTAMFEKAKAARDAHVVKVTEWKDFVPNLELNNLVLTPWCGGEHQEWEEWVKTTSREESLKARGEVGEDERAATSVAAKTLCMPFDQPELPEGTKCIASGLPATCWVLWGRSY